MQELVVRPSLKPVWLGLVLCAVFFIALLYLFSRLGDNAPPRLTLVFALVVFLWLALRWLGTRFTRLTLSSGKMVYESGMLSRTRRLIDLRKVQDVRVEQKVSERLLNTGMIVIETAGEASRLTMANIDAPNRVAEKILDASRT